MGELLGRVRPRWLGARSQAGPRPNARTERREKVGADGLTAQEGAVADALFAAVNAYRELPVQHPDEPAEFLRLIHHAQDQLAARIARRDYPEGWPTYGSEDEVQDEGGQAPTPLVGQEQAEGSEGEGQAQDPSPEEEAGRAQEAGDPPAVRSPRPGQGARAVQAVAPCSPDGHCRCRPLVRPPLP